MSKTEKGLAFLDKLAVAEVVLSSVGEELSDGAKQSKRIESTAANPAYRDLACSIYSTAVSLFEGYERSGLLPASSSTSADDTDTPTVNAIFCNYCKKKGHNISKCCKKQRRNGSNSGENKQHKSRGSGKQNKKRYPCVICEQTGHIVHTNIHRIS